MSEQKKRKETYNLSKTISEKYYGGKSNLEREISKAKIYAIGRKMADDATYSRIDREIPVETGKKSQYNHFYGKMQIAEPEKKISEYEKLKRFNIGLSDEFAKKNNYGSFDDAIKAASDIESIKEHEAGHDYSKLVRSPERNWAGIQKEYSLNDTDMSHMTKPSELKNGLGKIQRESFMLTGRRFEGPNELMDYVMQTPFEEATKGFSEEAKRTWRVLYDNRDQEPEDGKMRLLDWASKAAPAFVYKPTFEFGVT